MANAKTLLLLSLAFAVVLLIASEVSAEELAGTAKTRSELMHKENYKEMNSKLNGDGNEKNHWKLHGKEHKKEKRKDQHKKKDKGKGKQGHKDMKTEELVAENHN